MIDSRVASPIVSNRDFVPQRSESSETPGGTGRLTYGTQGRASGVLPCLNWILVLTILPRFTPPDAKEAEAERLNYDPAHHGTDGERRG